MYVLLVGYRKQLAKALFTLGIPYSVWTDKSLKASPPGVDRVFTAKIPRSEANLAASLGELSLREVPSHVIAGTEGAVFPCAVIRRHFNARHSPKTILTRCTDKVAMKQFLQRYGVPMTRFAVDTQNYSARDLVDLLGLPLVIKTRKGSGSRNLVIARSFEEVEENLGKSQIYEAFVDAPEGSVESFIHEGKILFSNVTDYYIKKHVNLVPAGYPSKEVDDILELNQIVIKALKIKWGMTHLEFYRTAGGILFGEIALRPPGGYIMELLGLTYDFDPWEAYVKIELGMETPLPHHVKQYSACHVLHPGEGKIVAINDQNLRRFSTVQKIKIKASTGDVIPPRKGMGEDFGYIMYGASTYHELVRDLGHAEVFVMDAAPDAP
jgi:hypothetical protein